MAGNAVTSRRRGFTLLEVMCAGALLGLITAYFTTMFSQGMTSGTNALARRELREAADTVFRKIIYEIDKYKDGDTRSLDDEYGDFASLRGRQRDRWSEYRFVLEKKEETVVGQAKDSELSSFNEDTSSNEDTGFMDDASGTEDEEAEGRELTRITMKIFRDGDEDDEPIFTLTTWVDPSKDLE